MTVSLLVTRQI